MHEKVTEVPLPGLPALDQSVPVVVLDGTPEAERLVRHYFDAGRSFTVVVTGT